MFDINKIKKITEERLKTHFKNEFTAIETLTCPVHGEHPKIVIPERKEAIWEIHSCCKTLKDMATAKRKELSR